MSNWIDERRLDNQVILKHGIRVIQIAQGCATWCIHCNCFINPEAPDHGAFCPYAALERADAALGQVQSAVAWYSEKAMALKRYAEAKPPNDTAMLAVVTELCLDGGARAMMLPIKEQPPDPALR